MRTIQRIGRRGHLKAVVGVLAVGILHTAVAAAPANGAVTEFPVPTAASTLAEITTGPDGALWFTEDSANQIGRITTTGSISEFPIPTTGSNPEGIAVGPDGALWFAEEGGNKIGRITITGSFSEFPLPTAGSRPTDITAGPDGALWFTEEAGNRIGRITTTGSISEFMLPTSTGGPEGITAGPDGALWFAEEAGNKIGRITITGSVSEFPLPTPSAPVAITAGPDGALWFTESRANQIGRITTTGTISEFAIPTTGSSPEGITIGPDGALWFAEQDGNQIGRITTAGNINEFPIPTAGSGPLGITPGVDGALWFTEEFANQIGRMTVPDLLSLTKADSPDPVPIGQTLTYTATIQSAGAATDVTLTDTLPEDVTFKSATFQTPTAQGSCPAPSGDILTCNVGALGEGDVATVEIDVTPQVDGTITNSASVSANEPDPNPTNNTAEESTTVEPSDSVSEQDVPPGETVQTGSTPTGSDQVVTSVTTPNDGTERDVSIAESQTTQPEPPDFLFLDQQVDITVTPGASPDKPLTLEFKLDASLLPASVNDPGDVEVFKDGQLVAECPGSTVAIPDDPCVSKREVTDPTCTDFPCDVGITVLTSDASAWNFGVRKAPGPPAMLALNPSSATNQAGQRHCVTATVRDSSGTPTPNRSVVFRVGGANPRGPTTRTTNTNGRATFCYTGTRAGTDTIRAFADTDGDGGRDPGEPGDSATKTWVAAAPATLTLTPESSTNTVGTRHCVTATVRDAFGNPTPNRVVRFGVRGSVTRSGSATTNERGRATFCYQGPELPGRDAIRAFADTDRDRTQDPGEPGDSATKGWVLPPTTPGCEIKVTDGGRITANNGDWATFGGNAKALADGAVQGQQQYQDHGPAAYLDVKSTTVQALRCSSDQKRATIFGRATVNGTGSFSYKIEVQDLNEPGMDIDTYRILLATGYDSGRHTLEGGNIQIHTG